MQSFTRLVIAALRVGFDLLLELVLGQVCAQTGLVATVPVAGHCISEEGRRFVELA